MTLRLEDIELIRRVKYAYFRCIDTCDMAGLEPLLHDDIEVDYQGGTYRWQIQGKANLLKSLKDSFNPDAIGCHNGHHPEIDVLTDTTATGIWYLTDVFIKLKEDSYLTGSAIYNDRYEKVGGAWKIRSTAYKRLYEMEEPLHLKQATFTAHYLKTLTRDAAE